VRKSILAILLLCSCGLPSRADADCAAFTIPGIKRSAELVFEGTAVKVGPVEPGGELAATLQVHRVWKGNVPEETTVYYVGSTEGPDFPIGMRSVIFAWRLTPESQRRYGDLAPHGPAGAAWVPSCSGPVEANQRVLKQLGRSRKPSAK